MDGLFTRSGDATTWPDKSFQRSRSAGLWISALAVGVPMLDHNTIRSITRSAVNYNRGIFCPAELWGQVLGLLTVEDAGAVLDKIPPEAQNVLRSAYRERPSSLQSGSGYSKVRHVVEDWYRRG
jgi:hypothetical protein